MHDQLHFRNATFEMDIEESRQGCNVDLVGLGIGSFIFTFLKSLAEDAFLGEEPLDKELPVLQSVCTLGTLYNSKVSNQGRTGSWTGDAQRVSLP